MIPNRPAVRLRDLSGEEIADKFLTANTVGKALEELHNCENTVGEVLEDLYNCEALTIAVRVSIPERWGGGCPLRLFVITWSNYANQFIRIFLGWSRSRPDRSARPCVYTSASENTPIVAARMTRQVVLCSQSGYGR